MNIKQAKQEITNTLKAYLAKDQLGNYLIPTVRQRPVLLMGPPGVGKTQIDLHAGVQGLGEVLLLRADDLGDIGLPLPQLGIVALVLMDHGVAHLI